MRPTNNILKVLAILSRTPDANHYPLQLSKEAKVNIGTVYALLDRLEQGKYVSSALEDIDPKQAGRPQRRYYHISKEGRAYLNEHVGELRQMFSEVAYA
ncbi:PadR family transcriptional regulator [Deinococcus sp. QL22]|uniref:PadR family transcriptional regulator n=1 Tax=Deinococcus sp. QL22 TaxID=2939437 RepID=UPI0020178005|nr:PadR family transcriptional regulator [Deinococcus sp. QL22]UQN10581.1 PadR family transcriptional regulator [Deinococcus sp. QL22]